MNKSPKINQTMNDKKLTITGVNMSSSGHIEGYSADVEDRSSLFTFLCFIGSCILTLSGLHLDMFFVFLLGLIVFIVSSNILLDMYNTFDVKVPQDFQN